MLAATGFLVLLVTKEVEVEEPEQQVLPQQAVNVTPTEEQVYLVVSPALQCSMLAAGVVTVVTLEQEEQEEELQQLLMQHLLAVQPIPVEEELEGTDGLTQVTHLVQEVLELLYLKY